MLYFIKFVYSTFFFPPGLFIILLLGVAMYYRRARRRWPKALLGAALLCYFGSIDLVGDTLVRSLEARHQPPATLSGDAIILLGGGATLDTPNVHGQGHLSGFAANRLLTAAQLYREHPVPIIVSGGKVLATTGCEAEISRQILLGLGVAPQHIIVEDQSLNTTENARYTKAKLAAYGLTQPLLVTSAFHMERSVLQFAKAGVSVTPYPTDYQTNVQPTFAWHHFWPSAGALQNVALSLKEYVGIGVVKWY